MSALNGQSGFGVESVRARIGSSASVVSTLSGNSYTLAAFLSDLERSVSDQENRAYSALAGAVPVEKRLADAIVSWTPGAIKLPWWAALIPIAFPFTAILDAIINRPAWWSNLIPIDFPALPIAGAIGGAVNWISDLFGPQPAPSNPAPAQTTTPPSNAPSAPSNSGQAQNGASGNSGTNSTIDMGELEAFKNYVLDSKNWTDRSGGAKGGIDVDGAFGEQCADISKLWYMRMYGVTGVGLSCWSNGVPGVYFDAGKKNMQDVSGGPYAAGDIGFTIKPPNTGHTYVIMSSPDANGNVQILEQNPSSPKISTIHISKITNGYRKK
jgi:hypothetical protein